MSDIQIQDDTSDLLYKDQNTTDMISIENVLEWPVELERFFNKLLCGVFMIDSETRRIVYVNEIATTMMKRNPVDVLGKVCHEFVCPAEMEKCPILDFGQSVDYSEKQLVLDRECSIPILKSVNRLTWGNRDYLIESFVDITKQKIYEEQIKKLSFLDRLTGLHNRHQLDTMIEAEIGRSLRHNQPCSMIMLDLDRFKRVNDNFGHATGDSVLIEIGKLLTEGIRVSDIAFRWGGEEFLILATNTEVSGASLLAEKLRVLIAEYTFSTVGTVTASFGVAEYISGETYYDWFKRLDYSLLRAKKAGRNRVNCWNTCDENMLPAIELQFKKEWESGNATIDSDHVQLIEELNKLLALSESLVPDHELLDQLDILIDRLTSHFENEEREIRRISYPEYEAHKLIHERLLTVMDALKAQFMNGEAGSRDMFIILSRETFINHILTEDMKFFPHFKGATINNGTKSSEIL